MPKPSQKSMHPRDFRVNATWLAFRITQAPIQTGEGSHDIFVLQDAASMFIFGTAFAPHDGAPPQSEVEELLQAARARSGKWPEELVLSGRPSPDNPFVRAADAFGIAARGVPEARISLYVKDIQQAFEQYFAGEAGET